ncbi:cupin-like domain-containing protein [Sphingomonas parva]|uniref:Cupin-like domain-containing protein n=1 Tax=Sphingomonas parva TaxID=2555898 RepID=A0A4Y8ZUI1_9SPHN|nr:cupin-like domain-containing protein [Sphingomonas parva]TFI58972.1 cupin-like domain-containing protein [Sphingomonas parva]
MAEADPTFDIDTLPPVREIDARGLTAEGFARDVASRYEPTLLRGLSADWPAVQAGLQPPAAIRDYLARFDSGMPIKAFMAPETTEGRFSYRPTMDGFNFTIVDTKLAFLLQTLIAVAEKGQRQAIYLGSTAVRQLLPGFEEQNAMPVLAGKADAEPRIWIGNDTNVSAHYDEADNIACVVRGRRRFVLVPPEQVANLYVGPLERTVAGRPTSLVDLSRPDFELYPRIRDALATATVADMGPGDGLFIPSLWWHHVRATGPLNILVNYWWSDAPADAGSPLHALAHGLLTISHLPEPKRRAWRALIDHYVFQLNGNPAEHIPPAARGLLGESTPQQRAMLKQFLRQMLSQLG